MTIYGFEELQEKFSALKAAGALGHAYLFFGDSGIGKWQFARALGGFFERGSWNESPDPLLDALFIERDPEKSSIGIDAVRAARQFLWQTPLRSPFRYVAVNDAHLLTPEAQGAMLKLVEEPPSHAFISFISFDPSTLDAPLRSRLQRMYCRRMPRRDLEKILVSSFGVSAGAAEKAAIQAYGRIGRALALLGKVQGDNRAEDDPERAIEEAIVSLHSSSGAEAASGVLKRLLARESFIKRFNINGPLQTKAFQTEIYESDRR